MTCLVRHAVGHHDLWPTQLILASRMPHGVVSWLLFYRFLGTKTRPLPKLKRGNECYQRYQPENGVQVSCSSYLMTSWYTKCVQ